MSVARRVASNALAVVAKVTGQSNSSWLAGNHHVAYKLG